MGGEGGGTNLANVVNSVGIVLGRRKQIIPAGIKCERGDLSKMVVEGIVVNTETRSDVPELDCAVLGASDDQISKGVENSLGNRGLVP